MLLIVLLSAMLPGEKDGNDKTFAIAEWAP
ncbi:hypothetical protein FP2506_16864 [Fulvimarina pelagi HTCC2506]|uniref:Uncharacterized protein n=1 Tax=Fulvimarina pelagi HTCC2506 TaxID=314231 RepID=Q0G2Q7_9HYPH|nr:hypothetical protein FP2506_16864 [Fulvimarina pelagi HTCC2506]